MTLHLRLSTSLLSSFTYNPLWEHLGVERYDELCEVDPLYEDLDMDATPQNFVVSIHNLYLDLRNCKWLNRDNLLSGLRLVLLERDDVFLFPIDFAYSKSEDSLFGGIKDYKWR